MRERIIYGWDFPRILRLIIGLALITMAIITKEWTIALLGGFFSMQSVLNMGCCGIQQSCSTRTTSSIKKDQEVQYEEVR